MNNLYNRPDDTPVTFTNCGLTAYTFMCKRYPNHRRVVSYDLDDECQQAIRDMQGEIVFIDMSKVDDFKFREGDIVFAEPISNPMFTKYDVKHICEIAHKSGAIVCIDNSLLSPANYNPFDDGADIVLESGTKWLSGSGDAMLGILVGVDTPESIYHYHGLSPNPLDCYLVQKGIPTLPIRLKRVRESSKSVVEYIKTLTQYVSYDDRLGMITFCLGDNEFQFNFCRNLKVFFWGAIFGQNNSTIQCSDFRRVSYLESPFNWCIRVSVGLEDPEDLINDLKQAYEKTLISKVGRVLKKKE
jgi:cystathionine gamma-synthase